jgi:hypothetical protein
LPLDRSEDVAIWLGFISETRGIGGSGLGILSGVRGNLDNGGQQSVRYQYCQEDRRRVGLLIDPRIVIVTISLGKNFLVLFEAGRSETITICGLMSSPLLAIVRD